MNKIPYAEMSTSALIQAYGLIKYNMGAKIGDKATLDGALLNVTDELVNRGFLVHP